MTTSILSTSLTSELDAINVMLATLGEAPINTLGSEEGISPDVAIAKNTLEEINREVQARGWSFNTEKKIKLIPSEEGEVTLPANCLSFFPSLFDNALIQRGNRVYDKFKHTYNIGKTIEADIILLLNFEELPEVAKRFITIKAARIFQDRALSSEVLYKITSRDEQIAEVALISFNAELERNNINQDPYSGTIFSSWAPAEGLLR